MIKDGFPYQVMMDFDVDKQKSEYVSDVGFFPNAHSHYIQRQNGSEDDILLFCISGKGCVCDEIEIEKDNVVIIPKHMSHTYTADKITPWSIYWVHFSLDREFKKLKKFTLDESYSSLLTGTFSKMIEVLQSNGNTDYALTCVRFIVESVLNTKVKPTKSQIILLSKQYIVNNLSKSFSISDLCKYLNLSKSHVHHYFKNHLNTTPSLFASNLKMQVACNYLKITSMPVNQIAFLLGYKDPYYFSRVFKKTYSISPKQYRVKNQNII